MIPDLPYVATAVLYAVVAFLAYVVIGLLAARIVGFYSKDDWRDHS